MRQFQVPQFITIEDKVIGPFTIQQSLYLGAGAIVIVFARMLLVPLIFWPIAIIVGGLAAALSFLKINEQPFPVMVKNYFIYSLRPRLYIWKKETPQQRVAAEQAAQKKPETMVNAIPKMTESKLSDLAWSLDIKQGGAEEEPK